MSPQPKKTDQPEPEPQAPEAQESQGTQAEPAPVPAAEAALQAARDTPAGRGESESIERYLDEADDFFGPGSSHVVAGAFRGLRSAGIEKLTRSQAEAVIQAWKRAPAATDQRNG